MRQGNPILKPAAKRVVIYSTCKDDWGGSEELWARSVPLLKKGGAQVTVFKDHINRQHPEFRKLSESLSVRLMETKPSYTQRFRIKAKRLSLGWKGPSGNVWRPRSVFSDGFFRALKRMQPDLVIISQAINFDGLLFGMQCLKLGIPYIIVSQKAVDFYWPDYREREYMAMVWKQALRCYFVSQHNLNLTEEQFGFHFFNAQVIRNPVKISPVPLPYPSVEEGYRLACVGRLFLLDKGQDILMRVLAMEKWKNRPLSVSFVGTGVDQEALKALASLLKIEKIDFPGFLRTETIWGSYHGLILPSRSEGMPLVITEAMAAGRVSIVTDAGGNAEIVTDETTGFIGEVSEKGLDEAMERAWNARARWREMGLCASEIISKRVHISPEALFVNHINALMYGSG